MAAKELISTVTVGAGGAGSISWTSIPQTGTDLLIVFSIRDAYTGTNVPMTLSINGGGTVASRILSGSGSTASSTTSTSNYGMSQWVGSSATLNTFSNGQIYIPNYAISGVKSISIDNVTENNASAAWAGVTIASYTAATGITTLNLGAWDTIAQYSTASLYVINKGTGGASVA